MRYEVFQYGENVFPFTIRCIGYSWFKSVTQRAIFVSESYIIHYVTSGCGYYNGHKVSAGQGFLIYPEQTAEYHADDNDPWTYLWIIASGNPMKHFYSQYNADAETLIFDYNSLNEIDTIGRDLVPKKDSILSSEKITELFLHIFNSHTLKEKKKSGESNAKVYLDFCINFVETNIHQTISVQELVDLLGISQPYLYKIFKDKFNMSAQSYILMCKLNRAKKLLAETDMSVSEVGYAIGYTDASCFSKFFSAKEGVSPKEYRNRLQNN